MLHMYREQYGGWKPKSKKKRGKKNSMRREVSTIPAISKAWIILWGVGEVVITLPSTKSKLNYCGSQNVQK